MVDAVLLHRNGMTGPLLRALESTNNEDQFLGWLMLQPQKRSTSLCQFRYAQGAFTCAVNVQE